MKSHDQICRRLPGHVEVGLVLTIALLIMAGPAWAPPGNDTCPGYSITSLPYSYSGSTATANNDYNDCVGHNTADVVFTLNLWYSYDLIVSLCGSSYDTGLEIRTGGDCPGTTQVGCNNDWIGCGLQSRLTFRNMPSQAYYIIVHGNYGQSGPYQLAVSGTRAVPNDDCSGLITISSLPYSHSGSTAYARNDWSDCVGSNTADVVYALAPLTCPTHVTVSLCGSSYNTGLEVRWGGSCPGNNSLACNDDYCGLQSQITFDAVPTLTYYFVVHGFWGQSGAYVLNVTGTTIRPANDQCPGNPITALPFTASGSTLCAANNYSNCVGAQSPEVVYTMTLPGECYLVTVSLCGSDYNTGLGVRTGGSCPGDNLVACNDNYTGCGQQSQVVFPAARDVPYYIVIHGAGVASGSYALQVTGHPIYPDNDTCPGTTITSLPYSDTGSTMCAHNDYSDHDCVAYNTADVVYTLHLENCLSVQVSLCGSSYNTGLAVWTDGPCPGSTLVACNDDYCGSQSQVSFVAWPKDYYILVHGAWGQLGNYVINVTGTNYELPNDSCPGTLITSFPFHDAGNTRCAQSDFPHAYSGADSSADVVYTFTSPPCTAIGLSAYVDGGSEVLEVRRGGACPGNVLVAVQLGEIAFETIADETYYVLLYDANYFTPGVFALYIDSLYSFCRAPNDSCPGTSITALPFTDTGCTTCAQNDYPSRDCVADTTADVVYRLHLENCRSVQVSLCGSSYNTGLAVWTDGPCPGQHLVACNDDYCGYQSQVSFVAWPDKDYYILVHGAWGQRGDYVINVTDTPPPNDSLNNAIEIWSSRSGTVYGTTYLATNDNAPFCGVADDAPGVWYRIHGWPGDTIFVSTDNDYSTFHGFTEISVYAHGCDGLTCIGGDDSSPGATVGWWAHSGIEYFVLIHGTVDCPVVTFQLDWGRTYVPDSEFAHNDTCPGTSITSLPYEDLGDLRWARYEGYTHCGHSMIAESSDVVYTLTLPESYSVVAKVCGVWEGDSANCQPVLDVRTGGSCPGASLIVCARDCLYFNATAGVPYYLIVYDYQRQFEDSGTFALNVRGFPLGPANDQCPGSFITALPFTDSGSTEYAANDYTNCVGEHSADVVYTMHLPECYTITASLCGSGYNTGLAVRTRGPCPGDSLVACNDDFCDLQSQVTFLAMMDTTYYLVVHGNGTEAGPYLLQVDYQVGPAPEPDSLVIQSVGPNVVLHWRSTPPGCSYNVYRAATPDVEPIPANLIGTSIILQYVDVGILNTAALTYFYVVTADSPPPPFTAPPDSGSEGDPTPNGR